MKRLLTYILAITFVATTTCTSYLYAFSPQFSSNYEDNLEEDLDDFEAIHTKYQFRITHKPKNVRKEYSQYSLADFTIYHEGFNPTMLVKVYVLHQSFLHYC